MKHIGIVAHSAEGSSLCYVTAAREGAKHLGEHMHPDISMSVIPMGIGMPLWHEYDLDALRHIFFDTAKRVAAAGADFFVCPDNTAHLALEHPGEDFPIPGLHIAEVVAGEAKTRGYKKIGLLGTQWTMERSVYADALRRNNLERVIPSDTDREYVDRIIFDELCSGIFTDEARAEYVRIIGDLKTAGCDAVVLGCTEIPILISPEDSPLPTLDSTRLLASAAVDVAVGHRPMPTWRGGPYS